MTSFDVETWVADIKGAFMSKLEASDVPLSYIEISNKIGLSERDNNNWFAMSIIRELLEEKQVEKEIKDNKTKYKIPGRVYIEMPEV